MRRFPPSKRHTVRIITSEDPPLGLCHPTGAIVLVDKPPGYTSRQIANIIQQLCHQKTGHGGTLDPFASGLLILATGKHTRYLSEFQQAPKTYSGKGVLGIQTTTGDPEGEILQIAPRLFCH